MFSRFWNWNIATVSTIPSQSIDSIFYQRQKKTTELCQFEPVVIYFKYDFLWIGSKGKPFRDMYQLLNIHVLYWLSSITPCMKTLVHQGSYENWRIIKSVFVVYGTEMIYSFTWIIANNLNFISLFLLWYRFISNSFYVDWLNTN